MAVALGAMLCVSLPVTAGHASTPAPVRPTGVHAVAMTASSFTVAIAKAAHTSHYRVYYSTSKPDIYVSNLRSHHTRSVTSTTNTVTVRGLAYTTKPYWYRVLAYNGTRLRYGAQHSAYLAPATPTGLQAFSGSTGTYLTWSSAPATGFQVAQSTDPGMALNRRVYTTRDEGHQFTPYGLVQGTTYWFTIRARNGSTPSPWTTAVSVTPTTSLQNLRVMSYNVLTDLNDGHREGDGVVAPWSKRVLGAAKLIQQADPDIVSVQEGGGWVGPMSDRKRQVDDLVAKLGGEYALARTEVPPTEHYYFRTGVNILYKKAAFRTVGAGDHWIIGISSRAAAYQELESTTTGARFLFVASHLWVGKSAADDVERKAETGKMIDYSNAQAAADGGVPIVYAGDFNSYPNATHPHDGPTVATRAEDVADAFGVAQSLSRTNYNSANQYMRNHPPAASVSIDHVYAPAGVGVLSFGVVINLVSGKFSGVIPSDHNPVVSTLALPY